MSAAAAATQTIFTIPDPAAVTRIIREVAASEILPRFRNLAADEIAHKRRPGDLVTIADTESERRLSERLRALLPGCAVVGEEGAEADPKVLAALGEAAPVWLLDPVDGTVNFATGKPCFAVIVGLCFGGDTRAGWIHDPLANATMWAVADEGAWVEDASGHTARLRISDARPLSAMQGSLSRRAGEWLAAAVAAEAGGGAPSWVRYGCVGREYMDLCRGVLDFAHYARLKPWDHAAGVLIHREAGGISALRRARTAYRAEPQIIEDALLLAPDLPTWQTLDRLLGRVGLGGSTGTGALPRVDLDGTAAR